MTISEQELNYLQIYKGKDEEEALQRLHPEMSPTLAFLYSSYLSYRNVNAFLSFIASPESVPLDNLHVRMVGDVVEMIKSIIHASCEYALENPPRQRTLYRYEHKNNLPSYYKQEITSMKSTSKSHSEATVFDYPDTVGLAYEMGDKFTPYISLDDVVDGGFFSDEKEILFPPFIRVFLQDESKDTSSGLYQVVKVDDDFDDESYIDKQKLEELYQEAISQIEKKVQEAKKTGIVSEELSDMSFVIFMYLKEYAREIYREYARKYKLRQLREDLKQL